MTEHTHHHDEDSACAVAHSPVAPASSSVPAERTLVAVFASPVAGYLLRYAADMGFRGLLLEPDEARAAGAAALGFPLLTAIPDDLDGSTDVGRRYAVGGLPVSVFVDAGGTVRLVAVGQLDNDRLAQGLAAVHG